MKKIGTWFATPQKAVFTVICMVLALGVLCAGGAYAVGAIAESSAIGAENAKNFAFADAGVDPASAGQVKAEFSYEQGQFVYEVEFTAEGTEYEYWIRASDGSVVKRELKIAAVQNGEPSTMTAGITADSAVEIALADAGYSAREATVTSRNLDRDNGIVVYEIDFYVDNAKYEYEINAETGAVYSKSVETVISDPGVSPSAQGASEAPASETPVSGTTAPQTPAPQTSAAPAQTQSGQIGLDEAKGIALADAGASENEVTFTKGKLDYEDGTAVYDVEFYTASYKYEYEIDAGTGAIRDRDVETVQAAPTTTKPASSGTAAEYIGTDRAKNIAVAHAGFSTSEVTFSKVKLDREDGAMVYEVEFYSGYMEYEYTIDAVTGNILEYDFENDD